MQSSVTFHLIPDGGDTIVRVSIETEFTVATGPKAQAMAEAGVAHILHQLTGEPAERFLEEMKREKWMGNFERPDEDDGPIKGLEQDGPLT